MAIPDESVDVAYRERTIRLPQYHVVLLDDDEHTYEYVIGMLIGLFMHSPQRGLRTGPGRRCCRTRHCGHHDKGAGRAQT